MLQLQCVTTMTNALIFQEMCRITLIFLIRKNERLTYCDLSIQFSIPLLKREFRVELFTDQQ